MWFCAHPADDAGLDSGPVVGRTRRRSDTDAIADRLQIAQFPGAGGAGRDVSFDRDRLPDWKLAVVERLHPATDRRARQQSHASLNCARSASRARASRDLTVPTATFKVKPISS